MSAVVETIQKVQKVRTAWKWISLLISPYVLLFLAIFLLACLIGLLVCFPFMLFGDEDRYAYVPTSSSSWWMEPTQLDVDGTAYVWPVPSIPTISSGFGARDIGEGAERHDGIDIASSADKTELQPVYAMAGGTVTVAGAVNGYGQAIYLDHGGGLVTIYGHLDSRMSVKVGDTVTKGQLLGRIGAGTVGRSTGPHLHFQVNLNGAAVDPQLYVAPSVVGNIPLVLAYRAMSLSAMLAYLSKKDSALADVTILMQIDAAGKEMGVSPHLLLAITGQEQSFVPKKNLHAAEIVRNPWNVYGCWCSGKGAMLTTGQAAKIAAKTIVKLSQDMPAGQNPIEWLVDRNNPHGYYASDTGWWIGVSKFYQVLLAEEEKAA